MKKSELIRLSGVVKKFDDEVVLKSLDLSVDDGEFVTLLGPSGCGKTTTLRIIAGLLDPDAGSVELDEISSSDLRESTMSRRISETSIRYFRSMRSFRISMWNRISPSA